jgi:hypothetical protein
MPFSTRPFLCSLVQSFVTYNAGSFFKLPLAYFLGFGYASARKLVPLACPSAVSMHYQMLFRQPIEAFCPI